MRSDSFGGGFCTTAIVLLWLGVNVADGFWIYFYVHSVVDPNPRTAANRTSSAFDGFEAMMFIFGFCWGIVNLVVSWVVFFEIGDDDGRKRVSTNYCAWMFNLFVVLPVGIFITIMPFFGGWIVTPIVQSWTWNHRCDGYPMYAILDGRSYSDASYVKNVVYFYESGSTDSLYTYEITNPNDGDMWSFALRNWNVGQAFINVTEYPTLQNVGYNFVENTLSGNCTVPTSPSDSHSNTTTLPCVSGTFDPGNHLFFNITSTVPLNNTANSNTTQPATTLLKIQDNAWTYYYIAPPALILHQVDPITDALGHIVLRTAVANPHDCTELKVCLAGVEGRTGGQVGAEVMAPLGVILMRQSDFATQCTTPSDSN